MRSVTHTTDDRFTADVLESDLPVVVDFTASWCPPCRLMKPVLAELAAERDDLRVVGLDCDSNPRVAAEHQVLSMPTFMVFKHGQPILKLIGSRPKRKLVAELAEVLGS